MVAKESVDTIISQGIEIIAQGKLEAAFDLFFAALHTFPDHLKLLSYVNLLETFLLGSYIEQFNNLTSIPVINPQISDKLTQLNFVGNEAFLLTQIDGNTNIRSLIYICRMGKFNTLRILNKFMEEKIIMVANNG